MYQMSALQKHFLAEQLLSFCVQFSLHKLVNYYFLHFLSKLYRFVPVSVRIHIISIVTKPYSEDIFFSFSTMKVVISNLFSHVSSNALTD